MQADPVVISAPREEVWKTLSDFPRYQAWCRFTRLIETSGQIGDPVHLHLRWDDSLGKPTQTQKEIVSIWKDGEAMGWSLTPGITLLSAMAKDNVGTAAKTGLGFGAVLAMIMSWTLHQSVIWVLIHGLLGWIYVLYYLLTKEGWSWF